MDQAVTQPARASSAAPVQATSVAAAQTTQPVPAHAATVAHTAQLPGFWEKSRDPTVFWTAASTALTFLAIVTAFLVPWLAERRQQKVRTRYAIRMLSPVFDEAVALTNEAEAVYAICQDLIANIGEIDLSEFSSAENLFVDSNSWRSTEDGAAQIHTAMPKKSAFDRIQRFAESALPAYMENRPWLMGLDPEDAGALQNAFSEALRELHKCRQALEDWPQKRHHAMPSDVQKLLRPVLRTREVSNIAARRLSRLLKMPFPEEMDDEE